jgi:hypothetical protein
MGHAHLSTHTSHTLPKHTQQDPKYTWLREHGYSPALQRLATRYAEAVLASGVYASGVRGAGVNKEAVVISDEDPASDKEGNLLDTPKKPALKKPRRRIAKNFPGVNAGGTSSELDSEDERLAVKARKEKGEEKESGASTGVYMYTRTHTCAHGPTCTHTLARICFCLLQREHVSCTVLMHFFFGELRTPM